MSGKKARVIAFYLPQYHPIPENDQHWGKGFTEWTNVTKAKPLFRGHHQPNLPADLGFYDLRLQQIQIAQAELARNAGIEGFCYWHYWFGGGKRVLEMPFQRVLETGKPDYPFCLGWANHDWSTKTWQKGKTLQQDTTILKQEYPGEQDDILHFQTMLPAFQDHRYIRVDGKLLFVVFDPKGMPDCGRFLTLWNHLAEQNGLKGFHFVALAESVPRLDAGKLANLEQAVEDCFAEYFAMGFDAIQSVNRKYAEIKTGGKLKKTFHGAVRRVSPGLVLDKYDYGKIVRNFYTSQDSKENVYPQLMAGWDRTPRSGRRAIIYYNRTPENFSVAVQQALRQVAHKQPEHRLIFLNSWNEWGEGAYMEPDLRYGTAFLDRLKQALEPDR